MTRTQSTQIKQADHYKKKGRVKQNRPKAFLNLHNKTKELIHKLGIGFYRIMKKCSTLINITKSR